MAASGPAENGSREPTAARKAGHRLLPDSRSAPPPVSPELPGRLRWVPSARRTPHRKGGDGTRGHQALPERIAHEIVNEIRLAEPHLRLRRVNIYVHFPRGRFQKDQRHGEHPSGQDVAVGLRNSVQDQPVTHQSPIDEEVNVIAVQLLHFRARDKALRRRREAHSMPAAPHHRRMR